MKEGNSGAYRNRDSIFSCSSRKLLKPFVVSVFCITHLVQTDTLAIWSSKTAAWYSIQPQILNLQIGYGFLKGPWGWSLTIQGWHLVNTATRGNAISEGQEINGHVFLLKEQSICWLSGVYLYKHHWVPTIYYLQCFHRLTCLILK